MRRIHLDAYQEGDREAMSPRVWGLIMVALKRCPQGDNAQARALSEAIKVWRSARVVEQEGSAMESERMSHAGGSFDLEESQFDALKRAWEDLAPKLIGAEVDARLAVDDLLKETKRLTADEYKTLVEAERG